MKIPGPVPVPADPDRVNVYTCTKCGGLTVTIDIHKGVTPFMLRCRASGREGDCEGWAQSTGYPKSRPIPFSIPEPAWEWFTPTGSEYAKLNSIMKAHVDKGGLDIRKRPEMDNSGQYRRLDGNDSDHPLAKILRENPPQHCAVCGAPPVHQGIFLPNQEFAKKIGQPEGKTRIVAYGLCDACFALPDRTTRVEVALLKFHNDLKQRHANG